jgi:hypothetical protein
MHMDEGRGDDRADGRDDREGRGERIGVGGGDDAVTRIQLAARWSEMFAPESGDSFVGTLKRFRTAYEYLDAVIHNIEPPELEMPEASVRGAQVAPPPQQQPVAPPQYSVPSPPPPPPGAEPRPW